MNVINPKTDLQGWLNQEPLETDIFQKGSGFYIPIEIIKPRLDILDPLWSTRNFKHLFFHNLTGEELWCSGSLDLIVRCSGRIERTLSGAATFNTAEYLPNTHFAQTCLSLCIVAAAKEIGKFFGRDLNKVIPEGPVDKIANTLSSLPKLKV